MHMQDPQLEPEAQGTSPVVHGASNTKLSQLQHFHSTRILQDSVGSVSGGNAKPLAPELLVAHFAAFATTAALATALGTVWGSRAGILAIGNAIPWSQGRSHSGIPE
jgi:hypothetical protein